MEADLARNFAHAVRTRPRPPERIAARPDRARAAASRAVDYNNAVARIRATSEAFDEIFDRCDAILTAAAAGPAPQRPRLDGDPGFCTLWTFAGMPAVTLPLLRADNGMPMGIQLVGRRGDDARLLRTARWLAGWAEATRARRPRLTRRRRCVDRIAKTVMAVIAVTLALAFFAPPVIKLKDPAMIIVILIGVVAMIYSIVEFVRDKDD